MGAVKLARCRCHTEVTMLSKVVFQTVLLRRHFSSAEAPQVWPAHLLHSRSPLCIWHVPLPQASTLKERNRLCGTTQRDSHFGPQNSEANLSIYSRRQSNQKTCDCGERMNNWFPEVGVKRLRRLLLWAPGPWWEMLLAYGFGGEFHTPLGAVSLWFCSLAFSVSLSLSKAFGAPARQKSLNPKA